MESVSLTGASSPKETGLYLSGGDAQIITDCFSYGPLEVKIVGTEIGKASAAKIAMPHIPKEPLPCSLQFLQHQSRLVRAGLRNKPRENDAGHITSKVWRLESVMYEIADPFQEAGLLGGFHESAAEIYRRIATARSESDAAGLIQVLDALRNLGAV